MSEAIIIAVISAISPVLVAIISIISNSLVVRTKVEQLQDAFKEYRRDIEDVRVFERWVMEDGRIISELMSRIKNLEDEFYNE
jgi:Na+-translocating ferredoxin:NAD+ oxidoreductase RnfG subunit